MKRLAYLLGLLVIAIAAALSLTLSTPATRTQAGPVMWRGHVVRFHLPSDRGLNHDPLRRRYQGVPRPSAGGRPNAPGSWTLRGPDPMRTIKIADDGDDDDDDDGLYYWFVNPAARPRGRAAALTAELERQLATGAARYLIHPMNRTPARTLIQAMSVCHAAGAPLVDVQAPLGDARRMPMLSNGRLDSYEPPAPPRVAAAEAIAVRHDAALTIVLDGAAKRMVWRRLGEPDQAVTQGTLRALLKPLAKAHAEPKHPGESSLTVLVHVGGDASWEWFAQVLVECAMAGIWRVEAVVEAGE